MFQKTVGFRVFFYTSALLIGGFVFLPLLWLINTALKPASETFGLAFFSGPMTLDNLRAIVTDPKIMRYLLNSLVVSFLATAVCAFAGYSFSKFRYRGRKSGQLLRADDKLRGLYPSCGHMDAQDVL